MKYHHSLRLRIIIAFCLFGTTICFLYGLWILLSMTSVEDALFDHQLQMEIDHFMANYKNDNIVPPPQLPLIKSFVGTGSMTDLEHELVKGRDDGIYEYVDKDIHVAVKSLPDIGKTLYFIYDVGSLEIHGQLVDKMLIYLLMGFLMVIMVGLLLGILTSRRVIAPIIQLADQVKKAGPGELPTDLSKSFGSDEVGVLAQTFEKSMKRIEAFIEREKLFTRDVSHELRTPVTVIRGAVEVLQQRLGKEEEAVLRPLERIERSARDMKNTIESLLWLARGETPIDPGQTCDVLSVVKETIEIYQNEVEAKQITLDLICRARPSIIAPPRIPNVLFSNLLRNALSFTPSGTVTVCIEKDRVEVIDTGKGIPDDQIQGITRPYEKGIGSGGFGLGLNIVQRLCDRFGWELEIESKEGQGTIVRWIFKSSSG